MVVYAMASVIVSVLGYASTTRFLGNAEESNAESVT